jgi:uncharacterized protein with ATP-grasp and redox domains
MRDNIKVHLDCFPCFLRQAVIAARLGTKNESLQEAIVKSTLEEIRNTDTSKPAAYTTTYIHRKIRQILSRDPFQEIKSEYNQIALKMYPSLKERVQKSRDPLWTAARLAIAGNVIDFGIFTSIDIEGTIEKALNQDIAVDEYNHFRQRIESTDEVLYLLDNAGEIVFDRILIETIVSSGKSVNAVVKGSPIINDATMQDAEASGLIGRCEVIDNGSDAVGTHLGSTSADFQKVFHNSNFIISKGQGNFETLVGTDKTIFFLLQSKCGVVSRALGLQTGAMLLMKN